MWYSFLTSCKFRAQKSDRHIKLCYFEIDKNFGPIGPSKKCSAYLWLHLNETIMKFLGFLVFLVVALMGFSMLAFLGLFVGYWLTLIGIEAINPKIAHAIIGHKEESAE